MNNRIFNRYERKYLINQSLMLELITFFNQKLIFDPYSIDGKHYTIYNLYFDTHDHSIIRNSIQKPKYKEKLRLRTYQDTLSSDSPVFLEIKKKYEGRVNKRRVNLNYEQAQHYLTHHEIPQFSTQVENQMMQEIDYFIKIHHATPGAYIRYDRIALLSPDDDLRITFDFNIIFRQKNVTLESHDGKPILPTPDSVIMEIKSDQNFPLWIVNKLSELKLYSQSFSKYGKAYEYYLGGNTDDDILYSP